jgi:hypothetical protein
MPNPLVRGEFFLRCSVSAKTWLRLSTSSHLNHLCINFQENTLASFTFAPTGVRNLSAVAGAVALICMSAAAHAQQVRPDFGEYEQKELITASQGSYSFSALPTVTAGSSSYKLGFEAVSQYDVAGFSRNFVPPDTMGAVGRSQYFATTNGGYGIFDKNTGARLSVLSDVNFWAAAGQTGTNGDSRVMYNADASRWIVMSFGANAKDLQIAVSNTDNALGGWKSTKFEGYAGIGFGGAIADFPTLAMDKNAVYIGTNNFGNSSGGVQQYQGTTLNVIPMNSLFNAAGPSTTNFQQFNTPYSSVGVNTDRGYAIQGVNSKSAGSTGKLFAAAALGGAYDYVGYTMSGLSASSAAAATQGTVIKIGAGDLAAPGPARQPSAAISANQRIIDASDGRTSSSVHEVNGRIYAVTTQKATSGVDEARIHWSVLDSTTFAILASGDIGSTGYDYYQGSIGVNDAGKVVIGYNRSGLDAATGKISFMAQAFSTDATGALVAQGSELLLKESLTDDYHSGSVFGLAAVGRQRWGDYSQVSVDPDNQDNFYLIGQFAREYNNAAGGHPGGTGGSRWSTWVGVVDVGVTPVPEPSTYLLMAIGLAATGFAARRRKQA